jgi:ribonuclease HI
VPPTLTLITDGACAGNGRDDARGGWAAILVDADGRERELTGGENPSTNNRMEPAASGS